ncbi:hypothetical protein [Paenibacillus sp. MMS20-IR301]|uniref:hypothetical protein n=1 Tax=Paenibacillus sp. MMS20-IR301 TaxID=2895946 RepID=UPI0028EA00A5|nr:hypothetical protein [Paenibacillus sp. MMS20-IR301]WNS45300.1 hypothetical protein LOS79_08530 [Paenibacillus sp. MMS20-IR301]
MDSVVRLTGISKEFHNGRGVSGINLEQSFPAIMRKVGCMIESADFYAYITAVQYLKLSASFYPEARSKRIDEGRTPQPLFAQKRSFGRAYGHDGPYPPLFMGKLHFSGEITSLMSASPTLRYRSSGLTSLMSVTLS